MSDRPLRDYGEDRLVRELTAELSRDGEVRIGPGDDCAVVGREGDALCWGLLKTDCLVEGRHFTSDAAPADVGWKAMARTISDIAAMGGVPRHALVTLAVSPERTVVYVRKLYRGIGKAAAAYGVSVVGGETASSPGPLFLSVAMTGDVEPGRCATRSGGKAGDALFVTGRLGGSFKSGRHLRFSPRVEEARWLTERFAIHAMMDLSDGLGADLPRLARASGAGFQIEAGNIPRNRGVTVDEAITDGEDYELLMAVTLQDAERLTADWAGRFPKLALTRIGSLTRSSASELPKGYDHFT